MRDRLVELPRVDRVHLATLDAPATHPRAAEGPIEVFGYVVHHPDAPIVFVAGQCGYCAAEFGAGLFPDSELHDPSWKHTAQRSLDRLRALAPVAAYFSHDDKTFEPAPSA